MSQDEGQLLFDLKKASCSEHQIPMSKVVNFSSIEIVPTKRGICIWADTYDGLVENLSSF